MAAGVGDEQPVAVKHEPLRVDERGIRAVPVPCRLTDHTLHVHPASRGIERPHEQAMMSAVGDRDAAAIHGDLARKGELRR
jgi:hypothetical protein